VTCEASCRSGSYGRLAEFAAGSEAADLTLR
jgi:hypothetical protein